jgi:DNA-binding response OmpR family regulator
MEPAATVLVVDDEAGVRFFLEELLTRDGHRVVAVESGEAALAIMETQEFDLALLDLKLKGIGGMEVLAALRQYSPDTVAIMLTGHGSIESAVEALRQGAHDYLFKPCKTVELRESVRHGLLKRQEILQQRHLLHQLEQALDHRINRERPLVPSRDLPSPAATGSTREQGRFLQRGGLTIDFMRHVITLNGQLLELSPTEFDLLAHLCSEAPRVVSSQELVREVQGYDSDPIEARDIVRYHIYRIRRKVKKKTNHTDLIRTVRGIGYTIGDDYTS